ncbi:hypothetical protein N7449_008513 [Penicillium cf. viridicatum]|uniref:Uncharacterized protein n=1 Tax=Penicillium cf. viridicatum TaxID=2972119 RepID=A0A9W9M7A4_9EURO|nr:hypothetical protein N7449_008513 [Penicillium cf. viridicatum]
MGMAAVEKKLANKGKEEKEAIAVRRAYDEKLAALDARLRTREDDAIKHALRGLVDKVRLPNAVEDDPSH